VFRLVEIREDLSRFIENDLKLSNTLKLFKSFQNILKRIQNQNLPRLMFKSAGRDMLKHVQIFARLVAINIDQGLLETCSDIMKLGRYCFTGV